MEHTGGYCNERIEEWMEQQEVSSDLCCDPQSIKRRRARYVLYKQLVLEEIEKRCQKYEDKLLPKEKEAIEEAKEIFSRGNYSRIQVSYNFVGTFYTPLTLMLSLFYVRIWFPILFPISYLTYWMIGIIRLKDKRNACYTNTSLIICVVLLSSCLWLDIFNVLFCFPFVFSIFLFVELIMLATSIVFCYGFKYFSSHGVLHYRFQISLIEEEYQYVDTYSSGCCKPAVPPMLKNMPFTVSNTIRHAPFRRLYSRPILNIFDNMEISTYNFGEIKGQLVTQDGIDSYNRYYSLYKY
uniref:Transmembrane protein n=1 Tax=Amphimedon queenslandica TaxID=400682 RepID=A0A1X7U8A7_AMPQE